MTDPTFPAPAADASAEAVPVGVIVGAGVELVRLALEFFQSLEKGGMTQAEFDAKWSGTRDRVLAAGQRLDRALSANPPTS